MRSLVIIVDNVRSAHNVGSILRTADGLGVSQVYLSGYTPYPTAEGDTRLPHIARRASEQIKKTAIGAELSVNWKHIDNLPTLLDQLRQAGQQIAALEQTPTALPLSRYRPADQVALIVGSEIGGLPDSVLELADKRIEIPMAGRKESFNVAVATAIAAYHILQA